MLKDIGKATCGFHMTLKLDDWPKEDVDKLVEDLRRSFRRFWPAGQVYSYWRDCSHVDIYTDFYGWPPVTLAKVAAKWWDRLLKLDIPPSQFRFQIDVGDWPADEEVPF